MATDIDIDEIHRQVTTRLRAKFPEVPADEVESVVRAELDLLASGTVRDYVEVLAERGAKRRLRDLAQAA